MNIISLFSGCGGLDMGFLGGFTSLGRAYPKHKFNVIFANDIDKNACLTYSRYFDHEPVCADIRELLAADALPSEADIVLGGFPCQDFSHAGKRKGLATERGTLYQAMCDVVARTKPALFIAENVKGLLTMNNGAAIAQIVKDFAELGYHVTYKLLKVADYGVPQTRERVIIVGTRMGSLPPFDFALMPPLSQRVTVEDAIGDLETVAEGGVPNHYWSKAKKNNGQGNGTVRRDALAPTIRAEHHGNIEFHYNGERRLSAREAARIQSFPDEMVFYPSTSSAYKQIGNAVPPVFAWHLARTVRVLMCPLKQGCDYTKTEHIRRRIKWIRERRA